jgi:hypothetical protein
MRPALIFPVLVEIIDALGPADGLVAVMDPPLCIRLARIEEATALAELYVRSKAVWGYDEALMALVRSAFERTHEQIGAGDV